MMPVLLALLASLAGCGQPGHEAGAAIEDAGQISLEPLSGQELFLVACNGCHRAEPGGEHDVGPNLFGVANARAAGAADYRYSPALSQAGLTWDRATLAAWIAATEFLVSDTTMTYANILTGDEVALVVDYLFDSHSPLLGDSHEN